MKPRLLVKIYVSSIIIENQYVKFPKDILKYNKHFVTISDRKF